MSEIVNLRRVRKEKARDEKEKQAAENRTKFGRTKTEKQREAAVSKLERRQLDQKKLTDGE
ncbi:MAG TPA: DUF4169 family protein [Magnetospirillaceae bacterium]|jgi:hypothetical protein